MISGQMASTALTKSCFVGLDPVDCNDGVIERGGKLVLGSKPILDVHDDTGRISATVTDHSVS